MTNLRRTCSMSEDLYKTIIKLKADLTNEENKKTVSEILKQHFKDDKITVKGTPLILVTELLRVFSQEALTRAADQAKNEGYETVNIEHFEKILPQMLLDM